jgi:5-methylcytosine-specific restriction endonuclease McrA
LTSRPWIRPSMERRSPEGFLTSGRERPWPCRGSTVAVSTVPTLGLMAVNRSRKARAARKRKRRMERVDHDLSDDQWTELKAAWGGCAYCSATKGTLQRDCVLALSRGGRYTLDNIVPACGSCNTSKCNEEVTHWLRRKRLDERTFLLRHLEIRTALAARFASLETGSAITTP